MTDTKELKKLWRNAESRSAFLDGYKDWGIWLSTPELGLFYFRYVLPDGVAIIAMEHQRKSYRGMVNGYGWVTDVSYFIQKTGDPFTPSGQSRYVVSDLLKDAKINLQKNKVS